MRLSAHSVKLEGSRRKQVTTGYLDEAERALKGRFFGSNVTLAEIK